MERDHTTHLIPPSLASTWLQVGQRGSGAGEEMAQTSELTAQICTAALAPLAAGDAGDTGFGQGVPVLFFGAVCHSRPWPPVLWKER